MTDKFLKITDDELLKEMEIRGLETEMLEIDVPTYHPMTAYYEITIPSDIQVLCEAFRYSPKEILDAKVKNFLIDHGGLIA